MNFFTVIFQGFWSIIKTAVFWEQLFVTVYLSLWFLLLLGYSFFLFLDFSVFLLKRHYIGFFENTIVYSCMCSTSVNLFSASWGVLEGEGGGGETPQHFDKSNGEYAWCYPSNNSYNFKSIYQKYVCWH